MDGMRQTHASRVGLGEHLLLQRFQQRALAEQQLAGPQPQLLVVRPAHAQHLHTRECPASGAASAMALRVLILNPSLHVRTGFYGRRDSQQPHGVERGGKGPETPHSSSAAPEA